MWKKRLSCVASELMATVPQGSLTSSREALGKLEMKLGGERGAEREKCCYRRQVALGPGGHPGNHEPATCPCCRESQRCPGLHQEELCQQVEGGEPSPLLGTGGKCWVWFWAPQCQRDTDILEHSRSP